MPKLHPQKQLPLNRRIVKEMLWHYNLTLRSFEILPRGIENTTVAVTTERGTYALRIYRQGNKTIQNIEQELSFMEFLRAVKIPIPPVLKNTFGKQVTRYKNNKTVWSFILMEFAEGIHPKRYSKETVEQLATIQVKMHKLGKQFAEKVGARKLLWKDLREGEFSPRIKLSTIKNREIRDFVQRVRKFRIPLPTNLPYGYNHLDIIHGNILVRNNLIAAILDFDDARYSPRVVCLGYTLLDILSITKKPSNLFFYLSIYTQYQPLTKSEKKILKGILHFRNYIIGAMEIYFYGEKGRNVKTALNLEKIISRLKLF